jgi:hypothetical protein
MYVRWKEIWLRMRKCLTLVNVVVCKIERIS